MTQKPTKKDKVGFLNLLPYSVLTLGIRFIRLLSYFPRFITNSVIILIGSPILLTRYVKKRLMR